MKTAAILLTGALLVTGTAGAGAAERLFKGALVLSSASSACRSLLPYIEQNAVFQLSYKPGGVGSNGPRSNFKVRLEDVLVSSFSFVASQSGNWVVKVTEIRDFAPAVKDAFPNFRTTGVYYYKSTLSIVEQQPAAIGLNTETAVLKGHVAGFGGVAGCQVDFRAALTRL